MCDSDPQVCRLTSLPNPHEIESDKELRADSQAGRGHRAEVKTPLWLTTVLLVLVLLLRLPMLLPPIADASATALTASAHNEQHPQTAYCIMLVGSIVMY